MSLIFLSILLSPWFNWSQNALSDLGHSISSNVAALFNFGLLSAGFLVTLFSLTSFRNYAKKSSYFLVFVGLSLQFIAMFDEVYSSLHSIVSVLFFILLTVASISYSLEKKSILAGLAVIVSVLSWMLYGLDLYGSGIAVPEAVSCVAASSWVVNSSFRLWKSNN